MKKSLLFIYLFCFYLLAFFLNPIHVLAQESNYNLEISPKNPKIGDELTLTLTKSDGLSQIRYGYLITPATPRSPDPRYECVKYGSYSLSSPSNSIEIKVKLNNCGISTLSPGDFLIQIYNHRAGLPLQRKSLISDSDFIIKDYPFVLEQQGGQDFSIEPQINPVRISGDNTIATIRLINARKGETYSFWWDNAKQVSKVYTAGDDSNFTLTIGPAAGVALNEQGNKTLCVASGDHHIPPPCDKSPGKSTTITFSLSDSDTTTSCEISPTNPEEGDTVSFSAKNILGPDGQLLNATGLTLILEYSGTRSEKTINFVNGSTSGDVNWGRLSQNTYKADLKNGNTSLCPNILTFTVGPKGSRDRNDPRNISRLFKCDPASGGCTSAAGTKCNPEDGTILHPDAPGIGILTALGCVPTDPKAFLEKSLPVVFGASGGVAFLLMIMGAFQMITSAGNPDSVKKGREQFNSAIIGLLFILFSVLLLQVVGFNILNIPGFGK